MPRRRIHEPHAGLATLEGLLGSKSRAVTRLAETSVRYELRRLERLGLLTSRREGREKRYNFNDHHPLFPELKRMVYKTAGLGEALREAIGGVTGLKAAFIYGSVAKGDERLTSDIDLFILGKPDQTQLATTLREAEGRLRREVN